MPSNQPKGPFKSNQPVRPGAFSPIKNAPRFTVPAVNTSRSTLHCPHCHVAKVSLVKKLLFGPVFRFRCTHCGGYWRVSRWSVVVAILTISGSAVLLFMAWITGLLRALGLGAGFYAGLAFVIAGVAIARLVPIRKAGKSSFSILPPTS